MEDTKRIYITVPIGFEEKIQKVAAAEHRTPSLYIIHHVEEEYKKLGLDKVQGEA